MEGIYASKIINLVNVNNSSSKSSSASDTKPNSFDSYLKSYSTNKDTTSADNDNSNDANLNNVNSSDANSSSTEPSDINSNKNVQEKNSNKNVSSDKAKNKVSDKNSEDKIDSDVNKFKDDTTGEQTNVQAILTAVLNCYDGNSIDFTKLKSQLEKLNISEDFQKDILDIASKLQDLFKGKSSSDFVSFLTSKINNDTTSNEHDKLINNIIDVLKSKLNKDQVVKVDKSSNISNLVSQSSNKPIANSEIQQKSVEKAKSSTSNDNIGDTKSNAVNENFQDSLDIDDESKASQNYEKNDDTSKNEDEFLNKLLSQDKSDSKMSKMTTFMNQFSTVNNTSTQALKGEVQVINKNNFAADIVKSVTYMQNNNIKELTVKINPKELGEVVIRLSMENNIMKASISAENKETYALLNSSLGDINNSLNNQNIKIQALSVNIYDDTTYFGGGSSEKNNENDAREQNKGNSNKENVAEIKNESNNIDLNEGKVNILA